MMRRVRNEISIHQSLHHPNILSLYHHFEDAKAVYLVMELCEGGELYKLLKREPSGRLEEAKARKYFRDICHGLSYLHHTKGIIHRDLKLSNILLGQGIDDEMLTAKIGDFGLACVHVNPIDCKENTSNMTICGTPNYLAPEVVKRLPYGKEADLWSLGCILYTMLVGKAPFEGKDLKSTFSRVMSGSFTLPDHVPAGAQDLVTELMQSDPLKRLPLAQVLEHPYITDKGPLFSTPYSMNAGTTKQTIDTSGLAPIKQSIKYGQMEIDRDGVVSFACQQDDSVMRVTGDGRRITFTDGSGKSESCWVEELGRAARKRYDYMKKFVDLVRSKTPLVIIKAVNMRLQVFADGTVACTGPLNLQYQPATDCVVLSDKKFYHPTFRSVDRIEDAVLRKQMRDFLTRLEQAKTLLATAPMDQKGPLVIDEESPSPLNQKQQSPFTPTRTFLSSIAMSSNVSMGTFNNNTAEGLRSPYYTFVPTAGWKVDQGTGTLTLLGVQGVKLFYNPQTRQYSHDCIRWHTEADPETRRFLSDFDLFLY